MTQSEADQIIREMKAGMGFSDEENDVFWSYTYDAEKKKFSYLEAWMVIGHPLDGREYTEKEFADLLIAQFDYHTVMALVFNRGKPQPPPELMPAQKKADYPQRVLTAIEAGDLKTVQELVKDKKDLQIVKTGPNQRSPLTLACQHGQAEVVEYLLKLGTDANRKDGKNETPLRVACDGYKPDNMGKIVALLFDAGAKVSKNKAGQDGAIHYAAMYGSCEAVKLLVKHGASVDVAGSYGRTPLIYAAADGKSVELVDFLLQSGADANAVTEGKDNALFDMMTRDEPSVAIAERLIDAGLDIHYVHPSYKTILGWAANCGKKDIVKLLLARGADVNAENKRNESPIAQAMMSGHHEIVKMLFAAGAQPDSKNYGDWSLLEYATEQKDKELVNAIIERCKKINPPAKAEGEKDDQKSEALMKAAEKGNIEMLEILLMQGADIDGRSRWGRETPLMKAAYYGQADAAAWLLDHGAALEARDSRGNTALLHAAWMGKLDVIRLLLKRGAEVNAANDLNWNALMQAALEGHHAVSKVLLEQGARTDLIDKEKGATVYYLAQRSGSKDTLAVVQSYGATPREFRKLRKGEAFVDIRDCEYCQYIPQRKDLANAESLSDYPGLVELHTHSTEVDRYATSTIDALECKLCGTFYQNDHYIDTEDAFVAGPTIYRHLQRFNFERLKMALAEYKMEKEASEFGARLPQLIEAMKEALAREGSSIHPHFLPHFTENVTDTFILAGDWEGLTRDLLGHSDKKLALTVADDLITIFGEGKYASAGAEQVYKAYRHITPDIFSQTHKLLTRHRKEFQEILKNIHALAEHAAAAQKVIESAKYYKI